MTLDYPVFAMISEPPDDSIRLEITLIPTTQQPAR